MRAPSPSVPAGARSRLSHRCALGGTSAPPEADLAEASLAEAKSRALVATPRAYPFHSYREASCAAAVAPASSLEVIMLDSIDFAPLRRPEPARPLGAFPTAAKRRTFTPEEKARLVAESFASRDSVCAFARRHQLSASQLFAWRKIARQGAGATLPAALPAPRRHGSESEAEVLTDSTEPDAGSEIFDCRIFATGADGRLAGTWLEAPGPETPSRRAARIEIAIGSAVVRVPNGIDRATLKLVLDTLREA